MDKHSREITVKINGKERPFTTDKLKRIETNVLEKEKEAEPRPFASFQQKKRKKRSPITGASNARIKSAIFSIVLAVMIGTGFGFIVLNVIPKQKAHSPQTQTLETALSIPMESQDSTTPATKSANEAAASSFTVSVIQAGVFTDREAAAAYAKQLQSSSIPVVVVGDKQAALFIAVGNDKQQLQTINKWYKQKAHSTYVKSLSFANVSERKPVIKAGEALYRQMADISAILLGKGSVSIEDWKKLEKNYRRFLSQPVPNDNDIKQYVSHMKIAYNMLIAYKTNQREELLQKTQQQLLEALKSYIAVFPLRS